MVEEKCNRVDGQHVVSAGDNEVLYRSLRDKRIPGQKQKKFHLAGRDAMFSERNVNYGIRGIASLDDIPLDLSLLSLVHHEKTGHYHEWTVRLRKRKDEDESGMAIVDAARNGSDTLFRFATGVTTELKGMRVLLHSDKLVALVFASQKGEFALCTSLIRELTSYFYTVL
jgi:hypothetical protein